MLSIIDSFNIISSISVYIFMYELNKILKTGLEEKKQKNKKNPKNKSKYTKVYVNIILYRHSVSVLSRGLVLSLHRPLCI